MFRRTEAEARILVLAPTGRDAVLVANTLCEAGLAAVPCPDARALVSMLTEGAAAAIIAEEALANAVLNQLRAWLDTQAPWSDFPFVVLTSGGRPSPRTHQKTQELERLGNVTFLERPVRPDTVLSAGRAALRARLRQYESRHHQEALTRANSDLEQFAHSASHDLREPIRSIAIYCELICKRYGDAFDEQGWRYLEFLRSGAARMEMLIDDLLTYTEASVIADAVHDPIDASRPLEIALANLRESIRESGACVVQEELCQVRIREVHLQQLFQNLIGNGIKYRSHRAPEIRVSARIENSYCVYAIRDNGIGIAPEYHEHIFGLFKRLHPNDKYPGTGMGLAICRRIVERYRGTIWVESEVGKGSNFLFKIPN
jgi:signal transduction histidine kinase